MIIRNNDKVPVLVKKVVRYVEVEDDRAILRQPTIGQPHAPPSSLEVITPSVARPTFTWEVE